jgi:hypothetical protein
VGENSAGVATFAALTMNPITNSTTAIAASIPAPSGNVMEIGKWAGSGCHLLGPAPDDRHSVFNDLINPVDDARDMSAELEQERPQYLQARAVLNQHG